MFNFENKESLPDCFNAGVFPSYGDMKGFLKRIWLIKDGTKIFSQYGYVKITPMEDWE